MAGEITETGELYSPYVSFTFKTCFAHVSARWLLEKHAAFVVPGESSVPELFGSSRVAAVLTQNT